LIISPCFNVCDFLISHIEALSAHKNEADILLINDGSTDSSSELIENSDFYYLNSFKNNGKASALKQGFDFALRNNYDAVLTIDSDMQHDHSSISDFITEFKNSHIDYLVGARDFKFGVMPFTRIISNKLTSYLLSYIAGTDLLDSQCGLRLIKKDYLDILVKSDGFQFESEHLVRSIWQGAKIKFIKTKTIYNDSKSSMNHIIDTMRFIKMYTQLLIEKIKNG
jgi:glycosyltransferase involved in cell wall biosynthesis